MRISPKLFVLPALLAAAPAALAQSSADPDIVPGHTPGVGTSLPLSPKVSNIMPSDTRSPIAPTPPPPSVGPGASVQQLLTAGDQALASGQSGTADAALEQAETNILTRSVPQTQTDYTSQDPLIGQIEQARTDIGHHDKAAATQQINQILAGGSPELAE